jgi:hypothetical protein
MKRVELYAQVRRAVYVEDQSAGSGTTLWDRSANGSEDAGILGAARMSAKRAAAATEAGSFSYDHRPVPGGG